jgi:uncharacterized protein
MSAKLMSVEVVVAVASRQTLFRLQVPTDATVSDALALAGFADSPELTGNVGIFSRICLLSDALKDGDRVEIYRPLIADPMAQRRTRAVVAKKAALKKALQ